MPRLPTPWASPHAHNPEPNPEPKPEPNPEPKPDPNQALYEEGTRKVTGAEDSAYLWHSLGSVRHRRRAFEPARAAFAAGLRRSPACSQLHCGVAMALDELGQQVEARRHFKRAVQSDERHAHAWQARGATAAGCNRM